MMNWILDVFRHRKKENSSENNDSDNIIMENRDVDDNEDDDSNLVKLKKITPDWIVSRLMLADRDIVKDDNFKDYLDSMIDEANQYYQDECQDIDDTCIKKLKALGEAEYINKTKRFITYEEVQEYSIRIWGEEDPAIREDYEKQEEYKANLRKIEELAEEYYELIQTFRHCLSEEEKYLITFSNKSNSIYIHTSLEVTEENTDMFGGEDLYDGYNDENSHEKIVVRISDHEPVTERGCINYVTYEDVAEKMDKIFHNKN